jgi:hypothetical protein
MPLLLAAALSGVVLAGVLMVGGALQQRTENPTERPADDVADHTLAFTLGRRRRHGSIPEPVCPGLRHDVDPRGNAVACGPR